MGMFDYIKCEYKLPLPKLEDGSTSQALVDFFSTPQSFQTKDLDCLMNTYVIKEDGSLWEKIYNYDDFDKSDVDDGKPAELKLNPVSITTTIYMCDYLHTDEKFDYWIEYMVTFIAGKVDSVSLFKFECHDNTERKKNDIEFKLQMEKTILFRKTKKYKYFYKPYTCVLNKIFRLIYRGMSVLNVLIYKLHTKLSI